MGSSGRDSISDYPASRTASSATPIGQPGQVPGSDPCLAELPEFELEDVANSEYSRNHGGSTPARGSDVEISPTLHGPRIAVVLTSTGETIGLVPTEFNWLQPCLGHVAYVGAVTAATTRPLPAIWVHLAASVL